MPAIGSPGLPSQRLISTVRAGTTAAKVDLCVSTRRREVRSSGNTRTRDTVRTSHPRSLATRRATRTLRSRPWSVAWMSGTTDLTSITRSAPLGGWNARTSIDPRSPSMLNETSVATTHPSDVSSRTIRSTRSAWDASSRRSRPSPCQRSLSEIDEPSAAATRTRVWTVTRSARPRSIRTITDLETPASAASRCCVHPRLRRSALIPSPNRTTSIDASSRAAPTGRVSGRTVAA